MKSKQLMIGVLLALLPVTAVAQQHIQQAFDELRKSKNQQEMMARHAIEKNPDTGLMEGLSDVYDFTITNPKGRQLITNIEDAFRIDEVDAYNVSSGTHGNDSNWTSLAVGDSNKGGVAIGLITGSTYTYACFLDPLDSLRRFRYAYALEWVEDGDKIRGRIAKTYATTQKYRQSKLAQRSITFNGNTLTFGSGLSLGSNDDKSSETWLMEFNTYKNHFLKKPDGTAASSYATQIYKLCKDAKSLEDVEKNMVATEILKLRKKTKDEFIQQLLDMSIERLKK